MSDLSTSSPSAQPKPPAKPKAGPIVAVVVGVLAVIGLINSGDDDPAPSSSGAPAAVGAAPEVDAPVADAPDVVEPEAALPGGGSVELAVVPDVVGMSHQLAQDTLQANGFYLLHEQDATGQGRMLIYDRNWVVVSQSVPAGSSVPVTRAITLASKKIGE